MTTTGENWKDISLEESIELYECGVPLENFRDIFKLTGSAYRVGLVYMREYGGHTKYQRQVRVE